MKIVFVLDSLGTGGAERSTADLWYFLRVKGIEPTIVVLRHRKEGIEQEILKHGFKVTFLKGGNIFSQSVELNKLIKAIKPDIVHSILFKSNLRVRFCRLVGKFRHIESLVNSTYDRIRLKDPRVSVLSFYYYKYLDRVTQGLVDQFLAITDAVKKHYVSELNISERKVTVLYRGRNENPFIHRRHDLRAMYLKELGLSDDTILLLHVGRQEFQKGHLVLLSAVNRVEGMTDKSIAFIFLGRKGNISPDIEAFLGRTPLRSKLFWLDHRSDVAQWMVSSDVFVFPSLYEGLGGVLIEAQSAGLPVICSNIPVMNEVVVADKNALMFEVGNAQTLADCLLELISDKERRSALGEYSLRNFREKFLLERINEETIRFYESLLT